MKVIRIFLSIILIAVGMASYAAGHRFTLVIDAGHGGHDAGAKGAKSYEKNINLNVALAFGKYVERNCPDVKVVYTRKTDVFIPLYERAEIANRNKADLFVSVHTNALPGGKIARGFETYTLGDGRSHGTKTNLDVAKRENSVIYMEDNYQQHYVGYDPNSAESNIMFEFVQDHNMQQSVEFAKLLQSNVCSAANRPNKGVHQDNFAVLRMTSMPACLIELGFITTPDEETILNDPTRVDQIARGIYNAFASYKSKQEGNIVVPYKKEPNLLPITNDTTSHESKEATSQSEEKPSSDNKKNLTTDDNAAKPSSKNRRQAAKSGQKPATNTSKSKASNLEITDDGIILFDENAGSNTAPATTLHPKKVVVEKKETTADAPIFKVQILTSERKLKSTDTRFKGLTGCESYAEGGLVKYTYGASTNYNEIYRLRKDILSKFPTCFIIAFKGGAKTDVSAAIKEYKQNKNK